MLTLLQHRANLRAENDRGLTPLHWACRSQSTGLEVAVDLLMLSGADETSVDNNGRTPAKMLDSPRFPRTRVPRPREEADRVRVLLA